MVRLWLALVLCCAAALAQGREAELAAADPVLEARMLGITSELRCLVCQNQTIADSHSGLAIDLRQQVREMLVKGATDQQVRDFMTARYGEFVLYRPPVRGGTALLWFGPPLLLFTGLAVLVAVLRRRGRLPEDAFEQEVPEPDQAKNGA